MWYTPTVTAPPASEPVSLVEAKRQLWVSHSDDDTYIESLISAVRDHVEKYCGARFATQTVLANCDDFTDLADLPFSQVQSVTSITYIDPDGTQQTLSTDVYELRADANAIVLKYNQQWPAKQIKSRITLTAVVGFASCPPAVKHAMLLRICDFYETRESAEDSDWTAFDSLLSNHRYYQ